MDASPVITAIQSAATSIQGDAAIVIGSAIGIGVVFFSAKTLWRNFKGMAK